MKKINRRRFMLITILNLLIIIFLILVSFVPKAYSRYESKMENSSYIETAIYLVEDSYQYIDVRLPDLLPQEEGYIYNFSISNNDGTKRTDTNLKYDLFLETTTNLPLEYEIYENNDTNNIIFNDEIIQDENGMYLRKMKTDTKYFGFSDDESNDYTLVIYYNDENAFQYQGMVESIRIVVDSKQILDTD